MSVTPFDITKMIRKFIHYWGMDAEKINEGSCHDFAEMVINNLGGETEDLFESFTEQLWDNHCWITFFDSEGMERHYDSETPYGVEDYNDLPFFKRKGRQEHVRSKRK